MALLVEMIFILGKENCAVIRYAHQLAEERVHSHFHAVKLVSQYNELTK